MVLQDFLVKQIQQFLQAILRRLLDLVDLIAFEGQDAVAAEMALILEQLSGLDQRTLQELDVNALGYLLNLRCEGENKLVMAAVLRLQADLARRGSDVGSAGRWETLAQILQSKAQDVSLSRTTADLLRKFEEKRSTLE